jgi:hypothetical protein
MSWSAERTAEFDRWWQMLTDSEQRKLVASVEALQELGPSAGRPALQHEGVASLRALYRVNQCTQTMRIFFAFDPRRVAILLIGGDKAGKTKRFYKRMIPAADRIFDRHLRTTTEDDRHG